jgi:hypothetical protein
MFARTDSTAPSFVYSPINLMPLAANLDFFNFCWIRELGAVVRQPYRWKDFVEHPLAKCFVQLIHDRSDRGRVVMVPQEACLE